jgi:hypothetical protein
MSAQIESKGFPKFENLEALIKERASLKQVISIAQKRMQEIEKTLAESIQALQYALSEHFFPPPSGDSDTQLVIAKLGNLMKAAVTLPCSQAKVSDTSPGNQGKVTDTSLENQTKVISSPALSQIKVADVSSSAK